MTPRGKPKPKPKPKKKAGPKPAARRTVAKKPAPKAKKSTTKRVSKTESGSFVDAFARLLRKRGLRVPPGLATAPREAYASQPASVADSFARLSDNELKQYAAKIASYAQRQAERARAGWEASPLIAELRRRRLPEPKCPVRVVGASVSLAKPLSDWTDAEVSRAAQEWSKLGQR